jgi:ATP-dependent Clp protease adaptor protein ClpS
MMTAEAIPCRIPVPSASAPDADKPSPPAQAPASPAAGVKERPAPPRLDRMPPWKILLHNDDVNDMLHVVASIMELCALPRTRAVQIMLEAHTRGLALLMVTHKERAELIQEQFRSRSLTVTIEPDA